MWKEHVDFHDQPLPYVFFGDVVDWAKSNLPTADEPIRRRFAMALNTLSASDDRDVWNLVGVSFFEPLVRGDERSRRTLDALRPWLSRSSLEDVSSFES